MNTFRDTKLIGFLKTLVTVWNHSAQPQEEANNRPPVEPNSSAETVTQIIASIKDRCLTLHEKTCHI